MSNKWSNAMDQGDLTVVMALDITGAFDRAWHAAMIDRVRTIRVSRVLLELLRDYLQG